jgi:serine phosphatase RsbU (regulator of sigma subunit)
VLILAIVAYRGYQNKKTANLLLAKQKSEILEKNATLYQQKEEITSQRDEIEKKNTILKQAYSTIENKTNKITSSISYALKIQQSILPTEESRKKLLPESFVLFIPKDIVSGDFYWLDKRDNKIFLAAVDCTGHGVPGAFMSMIAFNLLDQALNVHNITKPSEILNFLNTKLREKLHTGIDDESLRDGMDIALCTLQTDTMEIEYSGVHHPLYLIRNNKLLTFKPDNFNIGNNFNSDFPSFTNQIIKLEKDDAVYLFTDGYYDQFNSLNNKKFTRKRFNETLLKIAKDPMDVQHKNLLRIFEDWKGNNEQIDDILVMGIRI